MKMIDNEKMIIMKKYEKKQYFLFQYEKEFVWFTKKRKKNYVKKYMKNINNNENETFKYFNGNY